MSRYFEAFDRARSLSGRRSRSHSHSCSRSRSHSRKRRHCC